MCRVIPGRTEFDGKTRVPTRESLTAVFQDLVNTGKHALRTAWAELDWGVSPGALRSQRSNLAEAYYVASLGYVGLGDKESAKQDLAKALEVSPDHVGARAALADIE